MIYDDFKSIEINTLVSMNFTKSIQRFKSVNPCPAELFAYSFHSFEAEIDIPSIEVLD